MKVYRDLDKLPHFKSSVITLGSFDGVHSAHLKIIKLLNAKAREYNSTSVVISFSPHPRMVLSQYDDDCKLLTTDEEKISLLEDLGVENLVLVPFTLDFARQSPDEYVQKFICDNFKPELILLGYDHRFGLNRAGNIDLLRQYEKSCGYKVLEIEREDFEDEAISSTKIRNSINEGNIELANILLGRNYNIISKVIHGNKLGRKIGFRTANLEPKDEKLIPIEGVYASYAIVDGQRYKGMVYIGKKYFGTENPQKVIEINIFDFNKDIYGAEVNIEIVSFVRGAIKFESTEQIINQLNADKKAVVEAFDKYKIPKPLDYQSSVVILNYNGISYLEEFLDDVLFKTGGDTKFVIADNASTDDSINFIKQNYPEVEVFVLEKNYGFSSGYNRAIASVCQEEFVVFLNSDVEVTENWLEPIIKLMKKDRKIAIAQPKIRAFNSKEKFEYAGAAGGYLDRLAYPFCRGRVFDDVEKDRGQYDDTREVFWASGAAMVMRRDVFEKFGGFDPDFFAHQEEIDLAWRVKRAGYKVVAVGNVYVNHVGGGTLSYVNPFKTYLNFRNNLIMILKNESAFNLLWMIPVRFVLDGVAGAKFLFEGSFKSVLAILKAHGYVYANIFKIFRKRKHYKELIYKNRVGRERVAGRYKGYLIFDYFVKGKKIFKDIVK